MEDSTPQQKRRRSASESEVQKSMEPVAETSPTIGARTLHFIGRIIINLLRLCRRKPVTVALILILLIALSYYFVQYQRLAADNPKQQTQEEVDRAVSEVEKLMYISNSSGAQLASVTDVSKLQGQKFFENAQNGDYLLLFPVSEQAVLYRPSTKKIIQVGPFSPSAENVAPPTSSGTPPPFRSR